MTWNLIGNGWASELLARHIANGTLRQAYLITGPAGSGRRTLALRMMQALTCSAPLSPGQPCLRCSTCQRIERMQHPDLTVVQAEQVGGAIKVEQVRDLEHSLALTPYEAAYRFALLLRFEEASISAANALLKTLEEPNPQVIVVLAAESAEILLPTIVSRCEILRLRPASVEEVSEGLQARGVSTELARNCAYISGGVPGYALQLAMEEGVRSQRSEWIEDLYRLCGATRVERFDYVNNLTKGADKEMIKRNLKATLQLWGSFWRDVMLRASGASAEITNLDWDVEITSFARQVDVSTANQFLTAIDRTLAHLRTNVNARLALEVLMLDLPRLRVEGQSTRS